MVNNLSQLKKALEACPRLEIVGHCRKECVGEIRRVTLANTQGFYSVVDGQPEHKISQANNGKGSVLWWSKAQFWHFKLDTCNSLENGVILLYNKIKSRVSAELDLLLDEAEIDAILTQKAPQADTAVARLVEQQAQEFVSDLFSTLRERGLELKSGKVVFVGGGSILLRRHIEVSGKVGTPVFVEDIQANAKGYELLFKAGLGSR